jgi:hypothetical protein
VLPNGKHKRISGSAPSATNTQKAAEHGERLHVLRLIAPGTIAEVPNMLAVSEPTKEESTTKTIRDYAPEFLDNYLPDSKPSERKSKEQILDGHLVPALGHLRLDEIRQSHVDAFVTRELKRGMCRKTINNRLAVLSSLLKYAHENKLIAKPTLRLNLKRKGAAKQPPIHAVSAPGSCVSRTSDGMRSESGGGRAVTGFGPTAMDRAAHHGRQPAPSLPND